MDDTGLMAVPPGTHYARGAKFCMGTGCERGEKYAVSMAAGERVLLPAVRAAADETLVIADGFSCREQMQQNTARKPLHLAEVLHMALRQEEQHPEDYSPGMDGHANGGWGSVLPRMAALGAGALVVGSALIWRSRHLRR